MSPSIAVVTGVSKGLGESLAARLLVTGHRVVGLGRTAAARLVPPDFRLVAADLANIDSLPAIVDTLFDDLARLAPARITVVNNAAQGGPVGTIGTLEADAIAKALTVNLTACVVVANAFVRAFGHLPGDRRLINVSSGAAVRPIPGAGIYNVAKAGLEMLATTMAVEAGRYGITAVTLRPGIIDTPMQAEMRAHDASRMPSVAMFRDFHASGQLVPPDVTAAKIVERLVLGQVDNGRVYSYAEL